MRGLKFGAAGAIALLALAACGKETNQQSATGQPGALGGAPNYSGQGSPPAPPGPAPSPDQLAAAQQTLATCQQGAAVPNAEAVGPCMYDHGWVQKMTLDCSYGNKPNDAACYSPRGG
jgi:hypothetical protein